MRKKMRPTIAIDPGADGGAVVLDESGKLAIAAIRWRKGPRGYLVRQTSGGPTQRVRTLSQVARMIIGHLGSRAYWLGVEGLYVPRMRWKSPDTAQMDKYTGQIRRILTLAESTGQIMGPLVRYADRIERPTAAVWRPPILGLSANVSSDEAELHAIVAMTKIRPPLVQGLGDLATDPHVAEAACIARWTWTLQLGEAKLAGGGYRGA